MVRTFIGKNRFNTIEGKQRSDCDEVLCNSDKLRLRRHGREETDRQDPHKSQNTVH